MKVIILGANGQLGISFLKNVPNNVEIYSFTKSSLDIRNFKLVDEIVNNIKPDFLINCSAYTNVNLAEVKINLANEINYQAVKFLAKSSTKYNFNLIHFSTDYVFDGTKKIYLESDLKNPLNQYGISKSKGEDSIQQFSNNFVIFRVSSLFSPYGSNFVKTILNKIEKNNIIEVIDDQLSIPTCANDLTNFVWKKIILQKKNNLNNIFHYCNKSKPLSWYDFAKLIFNNYIKFKNKNSEITPTSNKYYKQSAIRPKCVNLDTNKLENYFNFTIPKLEQSLYKCIKILVK